MSDTVDNEFRNAELTPDLLAAPFKVQTNWHVLTGAPYSGKTTLIKQLAGRGFKTAMESARQYLDQEMAKGRTRAELKSKRDHLGIMELQLATERSIGLADHTFLDRAYPDGLAFCRHAGIDPNEILPNCFHHRYASVFILERFPVPGDGSKALDDAAGAFIDQWLVRDYTTLGYNVIRVPGLPPQERLAFILQKVDDLSTKGKPHV